VHLPHNSTTTAANAAMDAMYQQQPIRTVTTATATATATTAKKNKAAPKKKAANASPKRSKSPNGKNASKLLRNGEKGAEVHTVEEEYRIRLTRSIMQFRESDTVTTLQFPPTLTNTERKFVHELAQRFGLTSKSKGKGENRSITVTKPEPKIKTTKLNEDNLPELSLGPWGKDALHRFVTNYPPSPDEELESHETGKSLIQALGRGDTDDVILTRLNDLGLTDSFMMDGVNDHKRRRNKFNRPVDLLRRQEYHNKAQRRKQTHPNFTKMLNQRLKLPAYRHYDTVVQKVAQNAVTIISGETGCGKSTQIPQFILDANPTCKMVVTQPRRISAISIAERVAEEQCQDGVGGIVGYQVRLESSFTNDTQCIFMTPGILLNKMHSILDPNYTEYTHIIIDEIHERVREQEFLLIILRDLLPKRPDLRVVLMSATLQTNELVDYFRRGGIEPAVVEMEGRTFPVQEYFLEQVLEMTGFIDPSSKYDVGSKLESAMAELIGSKLVNNEVANVSLECAMCGKKGFTDPLALGEHIASCDGGLSFSTNSDDDASTRSAAKPVNVMDTAYENYINNFGEFDLSDVQSDSDLSDTSIGESDATKGGAKTFPTKEAIADVRNALKRQGSSKSQDDAQKPAKTTLHFNELIAAAPVTSNIELTPNEKALLTKYHLKQNDEDIDFTLILELVRYISRLSYGDGGILIFLPGWFEISYLSQLLESSAPFSDRNRFLVLPLHSGIASKDQRRVMQPPPIGVRKIVLSTNIAETSLTINDIVYVIDTGRAKEKNYDPHLKSSTLQPTWISRASAKQRKGRAGRVQPGICFHLFSRTRHESMPPFTESELLRTPLVCYILDFDRSFWK
jgi:ERCC4-related helicase